MSSGFFDAKIFKLSGWAQDFTVTMTQPQTQFTPAYYVYDDLPLCNHCK